MAPRGRPRALALVATSVLALLAGCATNGTLTVTDAARAGATAVEVVPTAPTDEALVDPDQAESDPPGAANDGAETSGSLDFSFGGLETFLPTGEPSEPSRSLPPESGEHIVDTIEASAPTIAFEWTTIDVGDGLSAEVIVPRDWETSDFFGVGFEAPDEFDFFTQMRFDTGCQGSCVAKDWQTLVMDDPELSPFAATDPDVQVLVRQELSEPTGRMTVYATSFGSDPVVEVTLARWSDQADKYFTCEAELHGDDIDLWPAFADACLAARPGWF